MITKREKEKILAVFDSVDVKKMEIDHVEERIVKWFRFGSYNGLTIAKEIIRQLPERKPPKKKKTLTKKET